MAEEAPDRPTNATNEDVEAPKAKRARTILACLACRQKKRRCDGDRPRCQRCVRTNGECEYSAEFYHMPQAEASTSSTRPVDSESRSLPQDPQPFLPRSSEGAGIVPDVRLEGFEPFKQLEMPKFTPPTSGPRVEDTAGVRSTFMFNPNEWSRPLVPRTSLSRSPGDFSKAYLGNPMESANPDVGSHADQFGYSARQPPTMTEGMPDQSGLDEWTQLFLTQVFHPDMRQSQRPHIPSTGQSPFPNLAMDNSTLQLQHNSEQSPNHIFNPAVDAISPQMSNGSSKRAGKYRIPYFRYVWFRSCRPRQAHFSLWNPDICMFIDEVLDCLLLAELPRCSSVAGRPSLRECEELRVKYQRHLRQHAIHYLSSA
jgi:hypothetical protein